MKPPIKFNKSPLPKRALACLGASLTMIGLVTVFLFGSVACSESSSTTAGAAPAASNPATGNPIVQASLIPESASSPLQETETSDQKDADDVLKKAGDLFEKAISKSGGTASGATKWVQDKLGDAADTGSQTADDSWKWATETFESLKEQGLTTASSTSEWLGQDWKNMENWEYKIETLTGSDAELTEQLNKLGKHGWDCFRVDGDRFFFKKPVFSYLRHMPFKDFIKLAPLMTNGDK